MDNCFNKKSLQENEKYETSANNETSRYNNKTTYFDNMWFLMRYFADRQYASFSSNFDSKMAFNQDELDLCDSINREAIKALNNIDKASANKDNVRFDLNEAILITIFLFLLMETQEEVVIIKNKERHPNTVESAAFRGLLKGDKDLGDININDLFTKILKSYIHILNMYNVNDYCSQKSSTYSQPQPDVELIGHILEKITYNLGPKVNVNIMYKEIIQHTIDSLVDLKNELSSTKSNIAFVGCLHECLACMIRINNSVET